MTKPRDPTRNIMRAETECHRTLAGMNQTISNPVIRSAAKKWINEALHCLAIAREIMEDS